MSTELITAIFTGLTGLVAAIAAFTANRNRQVQADQRVLKKRVRLLERQVVALVEHVFAMELDLASNGLKVPDRPALLEDLDADDDGPTPSAGPDRGQRPGHRHRA